MYGAAMPGAAPYVDVSDGIGMFRVRDNKRIEVLSGYPNVGKIFKPSDPTYDQVVKNLSAHADNSGKIAAVLGTGEFSRAMTTPPVPTASSGGTQTASLPDIIEGDVSVPFYKHRWVQVAGILGVTALVGGAIIYSNR